MITTAAMADLTKLSVDALIELIELDASHPSIGGGLLYFCNHNKTNGGSVVWKGITYAPYPLKFEGLEHSAKNASPRPTLTFGNPNGYFTSLLFAYQDLVGVKMTRRRVLAKYLDGMPGANQSNGLPSDVFKIERKTEENNMFVSFELSSGLDLEDSMLPALKCTAAHCVVRYRSTECSYVGRSIADQYGTALTPGTARGAWANATAYALTDEVYMVIDGIRYYAVCKLAHTSSSTVSMFNRNYWDYDQCSKKFNTGCSLRFSNNEGYPFLAFLGMTRLPQ